ncbi:MAG: hypothetical protein V1747_02310 [Candidatus Omnitrophota bacterium]
MAEKNDNNQNKNDFLEAKMYYYNTDALTDRDRILNSKNTEKLKQSAQKQSAKKTRPKQSSAAVKAKTPAKRIKPAKNSNQEKVLDRLNSLEHVYKQLAEKLNFSKVSIEVDAVLKNKEKFEDQISQLEQERLTLLEQITSLEEQLVFSLEVEAEKKELKDQVAELNKDKQTLENTIARLSKEMNDFSQTVTLENKKGIVYLSKEREALEHRITVLVQEKRELCLHIQKLTLNNDNLTNQITALEEKVKAVAYLDKKSAMFEEDFKESERKNQLLNDKLTDFAKKYEKLSKENIDLVQNQQILNNQIKDQANWQEKIDFLEFERNNLTATIKQLETENQDLIQANKKKDKEAKVDEQRQRLIDRVDELEEERIHLFKIVGELEEASKVAPDVNKKNYILQEEVEELKNDNARAKKQITEFIKNSKIMQTEIIQLKDKRASRLEVEQEKGKLQKRVNDLEKQCDMLLNEISGLNQQIAASQNNNLGLEHLRKELAKLEAEKTELVAQSESNRKQILELTETISNEKNSEHFNEDKIAELCNDNRKLLEQIKTMQISQPVNYVLDMEKLAELKEFVLESIQTRRWKSTEFVNGAYDAVGLFYRTILQERPIKLNK